MAGGNSDKILLHIQAIDDLYLPGPASFLFRCSKGFTKTYSIKPTTQFKFLFSSFCVSQGLDIQTLDFLFITQTTPLCEKSNPQQHLMVSGDTVMVMMKKIFYLPQLPASTLATQMKFLVNNPCNSDVTFSVAGEKIYAHKAILSARCEKFRSMFQNNMIESGQSEINLQIEDSGVLLALLEYIYTDNVEHFTCDLAFELMVLADEYLLSRLRQICEIQLQNFVNTDNAGFMLAYAHNHNATNLKQYCMNFIMRDFENISKTKSYQELTAEPDLLLEISKMLPKHLAQPINLAKKLSPKTKWSSLVLLVVAPAVLVFVAGVVYMKRSRV